MHGVVAVFLKPAQTPATPKISRKWGPRTPNVVGQPSEIIGFRNRGGGPVGHPQGVQVKTLIINIKCFPKGHRMASIPMNS